MLVSWSLTSLFSTNMAISQMKATECKEQEGYTFYTDAAI